MHINRGLLGWGVFFIVLGLVPLAVRGGVIDSDLALRAWQLWPLFLIGAGLGLVLARTRAAVIGGLVVAVTGGLMAGSVLAIGVSGFPSGFGACGSGDGTPFAEQRGTFGSEARVSVQLDCGTVDISAVDGSGWTLSGSAADGRVPRVTSDDARLEIASEPRTGIDLANAGVDWAIELPRAARTSLDLVVNAGSATARLDAMAVDRASVTVNAGAATLDLGGAGDVGSVNGTVNAGSLAVTLPADSADGSLVVNAGSLSLCVPGGVGLRFRVGDKTLGGDNFDERGLVRSGDTWQSPGYADAAARIDLSVTANLGSVTLNPEGGCER